MSFNDMMKDGMKGMGGMMQKMGGMDGMMDKMKDSVKDMSAEGKQDM